MQHPTSENASHKPAETTSPRNHEPPLDQHAKRATHLAGNSLKKVENRKTQVGGWANGLLGD